MIKWLRQKLTKPHLSELALEIKEALEEDEWVGDKYTIQHVKSGLTLWMSNKEKDHHFFRIYRLPQHAESLFGHMGPPEEDLKKMLTQDEKNVLAPLAYVMQDKCTSKLNETTLNALRLARQTGEQP